MKSYDYAHREGIRPINWEEFEQLYRQISEKLAHEEVEAVVGIGRAGLFAATGVAGSLRCMLFPVSLSRRVNDEVVYEKPLWHVDVCPEVKDKVVAVVDEIADSGETLALVAERVKTLGAKRVLTACLVRHSWAQPVPDVVGLVSDALVIFPWDHSVYIDGQWQMHPETVGAIKLQDGKQPKNSD